MTPLASHRLYELEELEMTREETKRDIHHLYAHWPGRMAITGSGKKALLFYEWLEAMDTGILSFGKFGDGEVYPQIAAWIDEWENHRAPHRIEPEPVTPTS
jgi:hypothetical protein